MVLLGSFVVFLSSLVSSGQLGKSCVEWSSLEVVYQDVRLRSLMLGGVLG